MKLLFILVLFPVQWVNAQSSLDSKMMEAEASIICPVPDNQHPVTLNAQLINHDDSMAVIVKVRMAPGWHIYQYVLATLPYIPIDHILQLPEGIKVAGKWEKTKPSTSVNDPGVLMYENEAIFKIRLVKLPGAKKSGVIKTGLYYQTCDLRQCLPPVEKIVELTY